MVDIPYSIAKHLFLDFFSRVVELDEVINILLKVFIEELLCIVDVLPEGSLIV
jgi:hypothetical protein